MEVKLLTRNFANPESWTAEAYEKTGGYQTLRKALKMDPDAITEEVKKAGVRGRGGAGFPTGAFTIVPISRGKPPVR